MSNYTAYENNNILIDLTQAALSTGWTVNGTVAVHDSCNPGNLYLLDYPLTIGQTYRYSYVIDSVSGILTTNIGTPQTKPGLIVETAVATSSQLYFYANNASQIRNFAIEVSEDVLPDYAQNTVSFSEKLGKWIGFYTIAPDSAFSMFTITYLFKNGDAYFQEAGSANRCNFFGVQYPATIWFSTNEQSTLAKTYLAINYQANQLLITPPSGINTSTGQVSELINVDFQQQVLTDGAITVIGYDAEGLYKASYMRAFPDLVNGSILKGSWLQMGLETSSPSTILNLFTTEINYAHSMQNIR